MATVLLFMSTFYSIVAALRGRVRSDEVVDAVASSFCDVLGSEHPLDELGLDDLSPARAVRVVGETYGEILVECARRELRGARDTSEALLRDALEIAIQAAPRIDPSLPLNVLSSEVVRLPEVARFVSLSTGEVPTSDATPRTALN